MACARWESPYIVEWLLYHRAIGFDHVYLFCNDDDPVELYEQVLPFLGDTHPFVTFRHFPVQSEQFQMYMHGLREWKNQTEWLMFLDIDEFICIRDSNNIKLFLDKAPAEWDCIQFNWIFFGNSGWEKRPRGSVLKTYVNRSARLHITCKTLTRTQAIDLNRIDRKIFIWHNWDDGLVDDAKSVNVIGMALSEVPVEGCLVASSEIQDLIMSRALVHHYAFKSLEDFNLRISEEFDGQVIWKQIYDSGGAAAEMTRMNEVRDTSLADFWNNYLLRGARAMSSLPPPTTPAPLADNREREAQVGTGYPDSANVDLLTRIPANALTILDVGCGTGALGAAYRATNPSARLFGIERDPDAAAIARRRLDAVACVDVQQNPLPFELPEGIDCLIYGDVLQQLRNPWAVLRRQLEALNPGGTVLICVANAEHWSMAERLLRGTWDYERAGLLDVRHLRWFSLRTIARALIDAGLVVDEVYPRIFAVGQGQQFIKTLAPSLQRLGINPREYGPRAMPLQYVLSARRAGRGMTTASAAELATDRARFGDASHADAPALEKEAQTGIEASHAKSADELPLEKLLMHFECLGDNCEFGLVQRQAGAEPLGLLRFASPCVPIEVRLQTVADALERRFSGLGSLETVHLRLEGDPQRREYLVHESAYQLLHHTFMHEGEVDPEDFRRKEARRLIFLRDKLMADLAAGEKLWVWKSNIPLSFGDVRRLLDVLRRFGSNTLLWVDVADPQHPPGTVERIEIDLLKGCVDRFAPYDDASNISFESWYAVSRAAYALWQQPRTGGETETVARLANNQPRGPIVAKDTRFASRSLLSMTTVVDLKKLRDVPFSRAVLASADTIDMPPCFIMNPPSAPLPLSDTPHKQIFPRQMQYPEMWMATLDDVYYLPYAAPFLPGPKILINDFLVPWGPDAVGWFEYEGKDAYRLPIDLDEAVTVDTAFFMGHPISGDFGHFIGDCLSRMHAWQICRELFGDVKIVLDHATHDTRFIDTLLAGMGVKAEDIVFAQGGVHCRKLLLGSDALGISRYASPTSAKLWQQIRDALADPHAKGGERIYFSRSGQSARKLRNEPDVEELFINFGFQIVHSEDLPVEEQISIVSNAQLVAGPAGAAMFNLAFQRRLKSVLILLPETFVHNSEWLFLAGTKCPVYYHFGVRDMPAGAPVSDGDAWRVDTSRLASEVASWIWEA